MDKFDLKKFKAGHLAMTRHGKEAKLLSVCEDCIPEAKLVVKIEGVGVTTNHAEDGIYTQGIPASYDLVGMATQENSTTSINLDNPDVTVTSSEVLLTGKVDDYAINVSVDIDDVLKAIRKVYKDALKKPTMDVYVDSKGDWTTYPVSNTQTVMTIHADTTLAAISRLAKYHANQNRRDKNVQGNRDIYFGRNSG